MILKIFVICLLFSVTSCITRQDDIPIVQTPSHWRVPVNQIANSTDIDWWNKFDDPVLSSLIDEALKNNQDLHIAVARIYEYRARLGIIRSQFYPQINGNFSATKEEVSILTTPLAPGEKRTTCLFNLFTDVTYEIDLWGRVQNASGAGLEDLLQQYEIQRGVVLSVVSSVARSYITLRQLDKQLDIAFATLESRIRSEELALARFKEGFTSELEVKQANAETDSARIQLVQLQEAIPQQENALSVLLGRYSGPIERGRTLHEFRLPFDVPAGLPSELLQQRPDILEAEHVLAATQFRIAEARAAFLPRISLTAFYGYSSLLLKDMISEPARNWSYGVALLEPLFTGGRITNQVRAARAVQEQALYKYFQTILTAFQEVNDALIGHQMSKRLFVIQLKQVKDLSDYYQLASLQYNNGQTDYLSVLDAQRNLFSAQLDLAQTEANTFITLVELYAALGGGWIDSALLSSDTGILCN